MGKENFWVKLISTFTWSPPIPTNLGRGRRGGCRREWLLSRPQGLLCTLASCPSVILKGMSNIKHLPYRLFKYESVQPNPTYVKRKKTLGWVGGFFHSTPSPQIPHLLTKNGLWVKSKAILCFSWVRTISGNESSFRLSGRSTRDGSALVQKFPKKCGVILVMYFRWYDHLKLT